jgi:hypothetical protein
MRGVASRALLTDGKDIQMGHGMKGSHCHGDCYCTSTVGRAAAVPAMNSGENI